ncbi:hypothetical protein GPECTOR_23g136 [Gonium pectorale]|uniref:Uncharacterized protein n=1 Tax=Gonium pectorale TaxID=33097 RepID=A0A150GI61_GONPE|nr:hypothetical protein GPECTOR_23g136 [Gonium pectorale]|eukprot:KXZ49050.1 hypothetical protein GPECTOR_23g136 [Gonium pectorale]
MHATLTHGPAAAGAMTHGSLAGGGAGGGTPADVRSCREALEARGFGHPGLQPGASWGGLSTGGGGPGASAGAHGEMHVMFEYLLLFPA